MSPASGLGAARVLSAGLRWGIARVSVGAAAGFAPAGPVRARPRWAAGAAAPPWLWSRGAHGPPGLSSLDCRPAVRYSCSERQLRRTLETPKLPFKKCPG